MTDDLAGALMIAPLRDGNDCGCAAMIHHAPPQAAFIQGPQGVEVIGHTAGNRDEGVAPTGRIIRSRHDSS